MKSTEKLITRLKNINWTNRSEATSKDEDEIYKFLKQAAHIISNHAKEQGVHPFSNFRNAINKNTPIINTLELEKTVATENGVGAYEKILCINAFYWANGCDEGDEICLSAPDLYDPIIGIIERRVFFNLRHGELNIGKSSFPLRHWLTNYYTL